MLLAFPSFEYSYAARGPGKVAQLPSSNGEPHRRNMLCFAPLSHASVVFPTATDYHGRCSNFRCRVSSMSRQQPTFEHVEAARGISEAKTVAAKRARPCRRFRSWVSLYFARNGIEIHAVSQSSSKWPGEVSTSACRLEGLGSLLCSLPTWYDPYSV